MAVENLIKALSERLFMDSDTNAYAVLDGASVPDLRMRLYENEPEHECLYRGELAPDMAEVAPYLVRLEPGSEFFYWVIEQGWGKHWGVFAVSDVDTRQLHRHFRRFLTVYDPDGKPLLFRYYDPRVLRVYLPSCDAEELATIFGPIKNYLLEDENPDIALRFSADSGNLRKESLKLG